MKKNMIRVGNSAGFVTTIEYLSEKLFYVMCVAAIYIAEIMFHVS